MFKDMPLIIKISSASKGIHPQTPKNTPSLVSHE